MWPKIVTFITPATLKHKLIRYKVPILISQIDSGYLKVSSLLYQLSLLFQAAKRLTTVPLTSVHNPQTGHKVTNSWKTLGLGVKRGKH
jgi:hypothetical protein